MGNRVGSSPTDRMQANGKEEKGCRIGKQGFEAAVLSGGIPFRCQALRRSNSWDLSELNYARQQTGRCLQKEEYHGGDFRLQMAEKRYGAGGESAREAWKSARTESCGNGTSATWANGEARMCGNRKSYMITTSMCCRLQFAPSLQEKSLLYADFVMTGTTANFGH